MSRPAGSRTYRALLRAYPRAFREEYADDMALLFAHQLRDDGALRVWARCLVDLAVTIPSRHLEARMERPPNPLVPLLFVVVAVTGLVLAAVGGTSPVGLVVGLSVALVGAALAATSWRRSRPVGVVAPAAAHWWKLLAAGAAVLAAFAVTTTVTGELPEGLYWPAVVVVLASLVMLATGLALGVARLSASRHRA